MITGEQWEIAAGDYRATIVEVGGALRELWLGERAIAPSYPPDALTPKCAGVVLVPWPNRIRDGKYSFDGTDYQLPITEPKFGNASHGFGRWARWSVVEHEADRVTIALDIVAQTGWPFEVRCTVAYRLDPARGLVVHAEATNHGAAVAPFGYGSHPFLAVGDTPLADVELRVPAQSYLTRDKRNLPTGVAPVAGTSYDLRQLDSLGTLRLDDCYVDLVPTGGVGVAELRAGEHVTTLWWDEAITAVQVFTVDDLAGAAAVAIEPMSCPPDAFNSGTGLVRLEPGATWHAEWGIQALA